VTDIDVYDASRHAVAWFEFLCHRLLRYGIYSGEANTVSESTGNNSSSNRREASVCACARSIIVSEEHFTVYLWLN